MLVICDFDGTFIENDVTHILWDHYIGPEWRARFLPPYRAGQITHIQLIINGYREISAPETEMLNLARPQLRRRAGFDALQKVCAERKWELVFVSGGIDIYVREFIPAGVPYYAYATELNGCWRVKMPPGIESQGDRDYKLCVLDVLKKQHPSKKIAFIGDGRNDFHAARTVDRIFAVQGDTLARLCREQGVAHTEFTDFQEIAAALRETVK